jgi:guanine deaminase
VQAHCTFLDAESLSHICRRGTAIAHCPLSNAYFSTEPFRLREALDQGVKVGLGTDIAGGYSLDLMSVMRQAVIVSRMREGFRRSSGHSEGVGDGYAGSGGIGKMDKSLAVDWKEALYLATKGGMQALGFPSIWHTFTVGAPFDAQCSKQALTIHNQIFSSYGPLQFACTIRGPVRE